MRILLAVAFLALAACSRDTAPPSAPASNLAEGGGGVAVYAGQGRDRLCLSREAGGRAGFIAYAASGDTNCKVRGTWREGPEPAIVPDGDATCTIGFSGEGNVVTLGPASPSCAYYCGPSASFAGRTFEPAAPGERAADFGGDSLC